MFESALKASNMHGPSSETGTYQHLRHTVCEGMKKNCV
jgi:hypothetical protein